MNLTYTVNIDKNVLSLQGKMGEFQPRLSEEKKNEENSKLKVKIKEYGK